MAGTMTAQEAAARLIGRAVPPTEKAGDIASAAAALVDLARADAVTEITIARLMPTRPSDRPLSEVNFLTPAEVAGILRVSRMTVYRLVHSGELPAVRVGRSFRVPEAAVNDYLWEHQGHQEQAL
jgi:excisionase family DNA binding protein